VCDLDPQGTTWPVLLLKATAMVGIILQMPGKCADKDSHQATKRTVGDGHALCGVGVGSVPRGRSAGVILYQ